MDTLRSLQDDRSSQPKDQSISIQWFGTPCGCRCRHCSLRAGGEISPAPFAMARRSLRNFVHWRDEEGLTDFGVDVMTGYPCDSAQAFEAQLFNSRHGATAWSYLPSNGIGMQAKASLSG